MIITDDRLSNFVINLECLSACALNDAFTNEIFETNGYLHAPGSTLSHLWEMRLHGYTATGASPEETFLNWRRMAKHAPTIPTIEDDGFVTVHPTLKPENSRQILKDRHDLQI